MPTVAKPTKKVQRVIKSWSTREALALELDRVAAKLQDQWGYTLDRSKLINCFANELLKAERELERSTDVPIGEESLADAIFGAICRSRQQ